jgi:hypothetical protein
LLPGWASQKKNIFFKFYKIVTLFTQVDGHGRSCRRAGQQQLRETAQFFFPTLPVVQHFLSGRAI